MELETVKVVSPVSEDNPTGYIVINKSDLTEEHELFVEGEAKAATKKTAKKAAAE
jgi:hypothetical protein